MRSGGVQLRRNIEKHGWDGEWYRRAYFDDGTPLGSAANPECQIDSISQSWSVLSGAGDAERARLAMEAVDQRLVRRDAALIQLLDPPFDKSALNPGYIKGYVPGRAREWRPIHACGDLDGDGVRRAGRQPARVGTVGHDQPGQSRQLAGGRSRPTRSSRTSSPPTSMRSTPHTGRGGWTWYTGSAGWMYRLIVESLLGLRLEVDKLYFAPCLPADWQGFTLHYRYRETVYHIVVSQTRADEDAKIGETRVTVDGVERHDKAIPLVDDRQDHTVEVKILALSPAHERPRVKTLA